MSEDSQQSGNIQLLSSLLFKKAVDSLNAALRIFKDQLKVSAGSIVILEGIFETLGAQTKTLTKALRASVEVFFKANKQIAAMFTARQNISGVTGDFINTFADIRKSVQEELDELGKDGVSSKDDKDTKKDAKVKKKARLDILGMSAAMLQAKLVMDPLNAVLGAFLEPISVLTPIFKMFGSMFSQLLLPLIPPLVEAFMQLTPIIDIMIEGLMPIITSLIPIIELFGQWLQFLVPYFEVLYAIIGGLGDILGVFIGWLTGVLSGLLELLSNIPFIGSKFDGLADKIDGISTSFGDFDGALTNSIDALDYNTLVINENAATRVEDGIHGTVILNEDWLI